MLNEPSLNQRPTVQRSDRVSKFSSFGDASVREPSRRTFIQNVNVTCFKRQWLTAGVHHGLWKGFEDANAYVTFVRRFHRLVFNGRGFWFILGLRLRWFVLNRGQRFL